MWRLLNPVIVFTFIKAGVGWKYIVISLTNQRVMQLGIFWLGSIWPKTCSSRAFFQRTLCFPLCSQVSCSGKVYFLPASICYNWRRLLFSFFSCVIPYFLTYPSTMFTSRSEDRRLLFGWKTSYDGFSRSKIAKGSVGFYTKRGSSFFFGNTHFRRKEIGVF